MPECHLPKDRCHFQGVAYSARGGAYRKEKEGTGVQTQETRGQRSRRKCTAAVFHAPWEPCLVAVGTSNAALLSVKSGRLPMPTHTHAGRVDLLTIVDVVERIVRPCGRFLEPSSRVGNQRDDNSLPNTPRVALTHKSREQTLRGVFLKVGMHMHHTVAATRLESDGGGEVGTF